jgi:hypothetical protein
MQMSWKLRYADPNLHNVSDKIIAVSPLSQGALHAAGSSTGRDNPPYRNARRQGSTRKSLIALAFGPKGAALSSRGRRAKRGGRGDPGATGRALTVLEKKRPPSLPHDPLVCRVPQKETDVLPGGEERPRPPCGGGTGPPLVGKDRSDTGTAGNRETMYCSGEDHARRFVRPLRVVSDEPLDEG